MDIILLIKLPDSFIEEYLLVNFSSYCMPMRVISSDITIILLFKQYNMRRNMVKKPVLIDELFYTVAYTEICLSTVISSHQSLINNS